MKLLKLSDIRRKELRLAALAVLQREGAAGTTLEKVAAEAGASKGIVLHYFHNKLELFEQAMREANLQLRDSVAQRMKEATTPYQRLWAIIDANLSADAFQPAHGHAWLSLCAEARREPQLARIQTVIHARMHSNLMSALVRMLPRRDAEILSYSISALIDGLWVRLGIGDNTIDWKTAQEMAFGIVAAALPADMVESTIAVHQSRE